MPAGGAQGTASSAGGVTKSALMCSKHQSPGGGGGSQVLRFCVSSTPGITSIDAVDGTVVMRSWSVNTMKSYLRDWYQRTTSAGDVALSPELLECRCSWPFRKPASPERISSSLFLPLSLCEQSAS